MDFVFLKDFFAGFTFPTLIIAVIAGVVNILCDKFLYGKINATLKNYAVFALAVILYIVYDALFVVKEFEIRTQALYSGILSGSLSMIITSAIKRIAQGQSIGISATRLLIESLIKDYVSATGITATAIAIEQLFDDVNEDNEGENTVEKVKDLISANANGVIEQNELQKAAELIVQSVKALKKE